MTRVLLVVNGPAYGADETYNALRLAVALAERDDAEPTVFLMGDAVTCAISGQQKPTGTTSSTACCRPSSAEAAHWSAAAPAWTPAA